LRITGADLLTLYDVKGRVAIVTGSCRDRKGYYR